MNEKKNIDRLFQEKFRDFEAAPPEMAWGNIEAELLKKKKKRRAIPLWYRVGGVAALLVVALMAGLPFFIDSDNADSVPVTVTGKDNSADGNIIYPVNDPVQANEVVTDSSGKLGIEPEQAVASGQSSTGNLKNGSSPENSKNSGNKAASGNFNAPDNAVTQSHNDTGNVFTQQQSNKIYKNADLDNIAKKGEGIAKSGKKRKIKNNGIGITNDLQQSKTAVAQSDDGRNVIKNNAPDFKNARNENHVDAEKQNMNTATAQNNNNENSAIKNNAVIPENVLPDEVMKINQAVASVPQTKDSTTVKQENELEKLLKEKELGKDKEEEKALADNNTKWNIKPQLAPLFYNSMGDGSPIDAQFAGNSKSYDNDLSYGVGINYAINDKISIRSGVNTVNLSYSTNGIQFYAALNQHTPNISARAAKANIVVENQNAASVNSSGNGFAAEGIEGQKFNGAMLQKMGYIEVPLEMSYKLLNKRFGIDLIGGVSTLFLNDNNVSVVSNQGLASDMGEAENLNNVHFSTNVGIGFRYRFWKSFEANFEPMFKYQLNTFSDDSGNFRPYFIGLYSGISFSF